MPLRRLVLALVCAGAAAAALTAPTWAASGSSTRTPCPGSFQVLNNDHIGPLSLPAGPYTIAVAGDVSCSQASSLFTAFLNQWTGDLPNGWKLAGSGFVRGSVSFTVTPVHKRPPVPIPGPTNLTCPGTFSVLHNDRIGAASFARGNYVLVLLRQSSAFSCQDASRQFALFLDRYYSGRLPSPWTLTASTRTFTTAGGLGFRTVAAPPSTLLGAPKNPTVGGGTTQGQLCPVTYRVTSRHARLDRFVLDKGHYAIWTLGGLSCHQAVKDIRRAVALGTSLPKGWRHDVRNAIIWVGHRKGFRLKLKAG